MTIFSSLRDKLGFTQNEARVILFLTATFLVGLVVRLMDRPGSSAVEEQPRFDYAAIDSEFQARSQKLTRRNPTSPKSEGEQTKETPREIININTASKAELMRLPGIGEVYAERIIIFREDHGPFPSVEALTNVKGIGKKTIERLKPFVIAK